MKVVFDGEIVDVMSFNRGPLVFRNDDYFERFVWYDRLCEWWFLFISAYIMLFFLLIWKETNYHWSVWITMIGVTLFLFAFWFLLFSYHNQLHRGIAVHENGVDMLNLRLGKITRVFVPWDQIWNVYIEGRAAYVLEISHGGKRLKCDFRMVDLRTMDFIIKYIWRYSSHGPRPTRHNIERWLYWLRIMTPRGNLPRWWDGW